MVAAPSRLRSLLAFVCDGELFTLDSSCVQEILWLPELMRVEECPPFVAGMVNRRGTLLPVVDLASRLGHGHQGYRGSDCLIVVSGAWGPDLSPLLKFPVAEVGIIASELLNVFEVQDQDIEPSPFAAADSDPLPRIVTGRVKAAGRVFMLLDAGLLFESEPELGTTVADPLYPEANPADRETFRRRSLALSASPPPAEAARTAFAVLRWGKEYVCVELGSVLEFSALAPWVPVPCCPAHVVGNMNYRGNVLTLIDLCGVLGFPQTPPGSLSRVVVASFGGFPVGILADEIPEVADLAATDIVQAPAGRPQDGFIRGVTPYGGRLMTVLNLKEILAWEGLTVDDEV